MALRWREATNPPPDPVRLRRANGQPLVAVAVPLTRAHDGLLVMEPACVLMLIDPEQKIAACAKLIQKGFGLSTAEARLAARLFIGESLAEASRELHLSYNTCKTQLKSIFDKTDCASQTALVKKLMLLALARGR